MKKTYGLIGEVIVYQTAGLSHLEATKGIGGITKLLFEKISDLVTDSLNKQWDGECWFEVSLTKDQAKRRPGKTAFKGYSRDVLEKAFKGEVSIIHNMVEKTKDAVAAAAYNAARIKAAAAETPEGGQTSPSEYYTLGLFITHKM